MLLFNLVNWSEGETLTLQQTRVG